MLSIDFHCVWWVCLSISIKVTFIWFTGHRSIWEVGGVRVLWALLTHMRALNILTYDTL